MQRSLRHHKLLFDLKEGVFRFVKRVGHCAMDIALHSRKIIDDVGVNIVDFERVMEACHYDVRDS